MKRVLMVTSVFPRYASDATPPFVLNQARALVAAGWKVLVLAPHGEGAVFRETIDGGVEVVRFPYCWPWHLQKLCYDGGMLVNFRTRPWTKALLPLFLTAQTIALVYTILRWRPDLLHSHSLLPQGFTADIAATLCRLPHITTSHGNDVFGLRPDGIMGRLKRRVLRRADAITVNSSATENAVLALGCPPAKVHRIPAMPNAVAPDSVKVQQIRDKHIDQAGPTIVFVGRMIEDKGVGELVEALGQLRQEFPKLRALLVGDGQDRPNFQAKAEKLGLASHLHWAGWVAPEEVSAWMAVGDVFVLPSKKFEAQGLVAVEAMLAGIPIVASRLGGLPDMIEDGVTGRLVPPGEVEALTTTLREVFRDPNTCAQLAAAARDRAQARFSPEAVTTATEALYKITLGLPIEGTLR